MMVEQRHERHGISIHIKDAQREREHIGDGVNGLLKFPSVTNDTPPPTKP